MKAFVSNAATGSILRACVRQRCNYTSPKPGLPFVCSNSEPVVIKDAKVIMAIALFFRWSHLAIDLRIVA